ncbi:hypothetical protein V6N13_089762 [Hibiscus sabdariffa]
MTGPSLYSLTSSPSIHSPFTPTTFYIDTFSKSEDVNHKKSSQLPSSMTLFIVDLVLTSTKFDANPLITFFRVTLTTIFTDSGFQDFTKVIGGWHVQRANSSHMHTPEISQSASLSHLVPLAIEFGVHKGSRVITLYVSNLPSKLHWSGLRQIFGFHGDVVDSFIASKLNKYGERSGFVRFSNITDAFRAIERLNGYPLYGSRIAVSLARFNGRSSYWRKVRFVPESDGEKSGFQSKKSEVEILLGETSNGTACTVKKEPMVAGEGSGYTRNQLKSIQGQVDEDSLSTLNKSLIGKMATVCSIGAVVDRL